MPSVPANRTELILPDYQIVPAKCKFPTDECDLRVHSPIRNTVIVLWLGLESQISECAVRRFNNWTAEQFTASYVRHVCKI